ncbi:hypothetical protein CSG_9680 [Campylobacter fetus subsp. venerealis str. 84-112]|nr:hypothetical protein CSG_9680 [Campylobacter fetus subsp. venerealis str. 84-112]
MILLKKYPVLIIRQIGKSALNIYSMFYSGSGLQKAPL